MKTALRPSPRAGCFRRGDLACAAVGRPGPGSTRRPRPSTTSTPITAPRCRIPIAGSRTTPPRKPRRGSRRRTRSPSRTSTRFPYRAQLTKRLNALYNYAKYSYAVTQRGENYFFSKNDGLQNQSVLYIQKGLTGTPEVLIDPNTVVGGRHVRLTALCRRRKTASSLAYGVSRSGSDWQEYRVLDLATRKPLDRPIEWVKVSGIAWRGNGFYYSRYPAPAKGKELSSINEDHMVYYHRIGTPQSADELVFRDEKNPQRFHTLSTTEDERFAVLDVSDRGTGKQGNAVFVQDLSKPGAKFTPLIPDDRRRHLQRARERPRRAAGLHRQQRAERPRRPHRSRQPGARELEGDPRRRSPTPSTSIAVAGGKVIATYMKDVASKAYVHNLEGAFENEIELPGLGSVSGFGGNMDDTSLFYTFSSFNYPTSIFRYEVAARKSSLFRAPTIPGLDVNQYETKQVFVTSKDGAKVPMFLVHKKGIALDGNNPTLMYGYGGFNIATTPGFNSLRIALLEQGFVYASVNMRGGSEYGEAWHDAGTKLKKQNVFDDFIAGRRMADRQQVHQPVEAGRAGRLERRPAGRRGDQPAARAVPRRPSRRSA